MATLFEGGLTDLHDFEVEEAKMDFVRQIMCGFDLLIEKVEITMVSLCLS